MCFKRNFILVGMLHLRVDVAAGADVLQRRRPRAGWAQVAVVHKLVYAVALLGLLHFYLKKAAKNDVSEVMVYAVILALLLGWRVVRRGGIMAMLRVR